MGMCIIHMYAGHLDYDRLRPESQLACCTHLPNYTAQGNLVDKGLPTPARSGSGTGVV